MTKSGYYLAGVITQNAKESNMFRPIKIFLIAALIILPFVFSSCACARPPRPGPNFVWIKAHNVPGGVWVPGHWKYIGPKARGKVWVPGHYRHKGIWVAGYWKVITPVKTGSVWIPGHYGRRGRWIPGHWR